MIFIIYYYASDGSFCTTPYCVVGCKTKTAAIQQMYSELGEEKLVDLVDVFSNVGGMEVSNVW